MPSVLDVHVDANARIMARAARAWACQRRSSSLKRRSTGGSANAKSAQKAASQPLPGETVPHQESEERGGGGVVCRYAEESAYGASGAVAFRER